MYTYDGKVHISSSLVFRSFQRTSPLFFVQELVDQVSPWKYGVTLFNVSQPHVANTSKYEGKRRNVGPRMWFRGK